MKGWSRCFPRINWAPRTGLPMAPSVCRGKTPAIRWKTRIIDEILIECSFSQSTKLTFCWFTIIHLFSHLFSNLKLFLIRNAPELFFSRIFFFFPKCCEMGMNVFFSWLMTVVANMNLIDFFIPPRNWSEDITTVGIVEAVFFIGGPRGRNKEILSYPIRLNRCLLLSFLSILRQDVCIFASEGCQPL